MAQNYRDVAREVYARNYYNGTYGGAAIPVDEQQRYLMAAADKLVLYDRIYTVVAPDESAEHNAICAMADAMYQFDLIANGEAGAVKSASIGSVSVSYGFSANAVDISPKGQERELYRCATMYLDIYRGVR